MRNLPSKWIIHIFTALHAVATIVCMASGLRDSLVLTVLTMAMAILICYRESLTVEITIASTVLLNILGFLLGSLFALFLFVNLRPIWQHAVSTAIVTELLGWGLYGFANIFPKEGSAAYERAQSWKKHRFALIFAIAILLTLRFYLADTYTGNIFKDFGVVSLLIVGTVIAFGYMITVAIQMQREATRQRTRRHQAEFRYMTLKHQVNPHFLFNSLNVLDSIVLEGTREEASKYIHKMASIYRYLVKQEGERIVPLDEELDFAKNYKELIEIRFPKGIVFHASDILENPPAGYIVPCTLQLLLENAIKHNAFSDDEPMIIEISHDKDTIVMKNTLRPKTFTRPSLGIGLQYIRNQYRDLAGKEISVEKTSNSFIVTLPILQSPNNLVNLRRESKHL